MENTINILSTKKLGQQQKELLQNAGIGLVEYDALNVVFLNPDLSSIEDNIIITSKNAFKSIRQSDAWETVKDKNWYCVGEKTRSILSENRIEPIEKGKNSSDLALKIIEKGDDEKYTYFSGNQRRDELPDLLKQNGVSFKEYTVYETHAVSKKIDGGFDGLLFFSPSGIRSYTLENKIKDETCFCIGDTTAAEAKKHTNKIIKADRPLLENVLNAVVKYFNSSK